MVKFFIILMFIAIVYNLGHALYFLLRHKSHSTEMARALSYRIGLSLLLFILLIVGFLTGVIQPHGVG